eukprot:gene1486-1874_t
MTIINAITGLGGINNSSFSVSKSIVSSSNMDPSLINIQGSNSNTGLIYIWCSGCSRNLDKLEELFWEISNPKSSSYRQFLSKDEVDMLVASPVEAIKDVTEWLIESGINKNNIEINSDYISVVSTVKKASQLFESQFFEYKSRSRSSSRRIRIHGKAYIPAHIHQHIHFVLGISDFFEDNKKQEPMRTSSKANPTSVVINPLVVRQLYNVPTDLLSTNENNFQSIAAFQDYYASGALKFFDKKFSINSSLVRLKAVGDDCLNSLCDQYESDLDVQYITAVGLNTSTLFLTSGSGKWVLDWAIEIASYQPLPLVSSISYGLSENLQCLITSDCQSLGLDYQQYIARTDTQFQKLGVQGMSILVSSGDDGAPSYYTDVNCPQSLEPYCPSGQCKYQSTQCAEVIIQGPKGELCFFPIGSGSDNCESIIQSTKGFNALHVFIKNNSQTCNTYLDNDNNDDMYIYSECPCSSLKPVSIHGYTITPYTYSASNGQMFNPDYPTSSPYVTSVGATQALTSGQEIVCSIETGAIITGGGGFSWSQPQPSYQAQAVQSFLSNAGQTLPPSNTFNTSNRAYPDITLVGHSYQIATTKDLTSSQCPCFLATVDGTSCSSPTTAGMISLINDQLLNAGKQPLGFLNPLLYQAAQDQPNVFNDITQGNINCNRAYCCDYGFSATTGYDVTSGLGSINYGNLEQYILKNL